MQCFLSISCAILGLKISVGWTNTLEVTRPRVRVPTHPLPYQTYVTLCLPIQIDFFSKNIKKSAFLEALLLRPLLWGVFIGKASPGDMIARESMASLLPCNWRRVGHFKFCRWASGQVTGLLYIIDAASTSWAYTVIHPLLTSSAYVQPCLCKA